MPGSRVRPGHWRHIPTRMSLEFQAATPSTPGLTFTSFQPALLLDSGLGLCDVPPRPALPIRSGTSGLRIVQASSEWISGTEKVRRGLTLALSTCP